MRFQENTQTQYAIDAILDMDVQASEEISETEFWKSLEHQTQFQDGIDSGIIKLGYDGAKDDVSAKVRFITEQFKKHDIDPVSTTTLKNWYTKATPGDNSASRPNVYKLCFALEMNAIETAEFFLKDYLTRPFNYKDTAEAVYYWCLLNGKSYTNAEKLIAEIKSAETEIRADRDIETESLGNEISYIKDESELVNYLAEHRYGKSEQHTTATDMISELLERCYKTATLEMPYINEKPRKIDHTDALLDVIYDFDAAKIKTSIAESKLPEAIKDNWLTKQLFSNIKLHKIGAEDIYRRALILLTFYDFYASAFVEQRKTKTELDIDLIGLADEFLTELDATLAECGYVQLYPRNPFDGLIYFCTAYPNPISRFRNIIDEFYLDDAEFYPDKAKFSEE